jgi:hypothetical protein
MTITQVVASNPKPIRFLVSASAEQDPLGRASAMAMIAQPGHLPQWLSYADIMVGSLVAAKHFELDNDMPPGIEPMPGEYMLAEHTLNLVLAKKLSALPASSVFGEDIMFVQNEGSDDVGIVIDMAARIYGLENGNDENNEFDLIIERDGNYLGFQTLLLVALPNGAVDRWDADKVSHIEGEDGLELYRAQIWVVGDDIAAPTPPADVQLPKNWAVSGTDVNGEFYTHIYNSMDEETAKATFISEMGTEGDEAGAAAQILGVVSSYTEIMSA